MITIAANGRQAGDQRGTLGSDEAWLVWPVGAARIERRADRRAAARSVRGRRRLHRLRARWPAGALASTVGLWIAGAVLSRTCLEPRRREAFRLARARRCREAPGTEAELGNIAGRGQSRRSGRPDRAPRLHGGRSGNRRDRRGSGGCTRGRPPDVPSESKKNNGRASPAATSKWNRSTWSRSIVFRLDRQRDVSQPLVE